MEHAGLSNGRGIPVGLSISDAMGVDNLEIDRQPTVEETITIDLAHPAIRRALKQHGYASGSIIWESCGARVSSVGYTWSPACALLELRWSTRVSAFRQTVQIATTTPNFGGMRMWFVCPLSGKRARALFLPNGAKHWASRAAYGLSYTSQRLAPAHRRFATMLARHHRSERRNATRRHTRSPSERQRSA